MIQVSINKEIFKSRHTTAVFALGIFLVLFGIAGFFMDPVVGQFATDTVQNGLHIFSGLTLLLFGTKTDAASRKFAVYFGVLYALLSIIGFLSVRDVGMLLGIMEVGIQGNFLHLLIGSGLLGVAFL